MMQKYDSLSLNLTSFWFTDQLFHRPRNCSQNWTAAMYVSQPKDWDAALGSTASLKAVICPSVSGHAVSGTMTLEWSSNGSPLFSHSMSGISMPYKLRAFWVVCSKSRHIFKYYSMCCWLLIKLLKYVNHTIHSNHIIFACTSVLSGPGIG